MLVVANFVLPRALPGDPFGYAGEDGGAGVRYTQATIDRYTAYVGSGELDPGEFAAYLGRLASGDLGWSLRYGRGVAELIADRAPWTIGIAVAATTIAVSAGITLGLAAAYGRGRLPDRLLHPLLTAQSRVPAFLIAVVLLMVFGVQLGWAPIGGGADPFSAAAPLGERVADILAHAALPVASIALAQAGGYALLVRAATLDVLSRRWTTTATAEGLGPARVARRHVLRPALVPLVTRTLRGLGMLLGGAVLVEQVFAYPGLGLLLWEAVESRDYVLMQGVFLVTALAVLALNALADLLAPVLDPRTSHRIPALTAERH